MYANNLFTLNNIPTLSVGGGLCECGATEAGAEVRPDDIVFVNAVQCGRTILATTLTGTGGMRQLMASVRLLLAETAGVVTVHLRNRTQGWTVTRSVKINSAASMLDAFAGVA